MKPVTTAFSALLVALGVAMLVRTAVAGAGVGPAFGYVAGAAFIGAGAARLYLAISRSGAERNG
jgi:hypothetical protein